MATEAPLSISVAKPSSFGGFFPDPAVAKDLAAKLEKLAAPKAAASSEGDAYAPLTPTFSVPLTTAGSTTPLSPLSTPTTPVAAIVLVGPGEAAAAAAAKQPLKQQYGQSPEAQARAAAAAAVAAGVDGTCPLDDAAGFAEGFLTGRVPEPRAAPVGNPLDDAEAFAAGFDLGYESDAEEDPAAFRRDPGNPLEADGFAAGFELGGAAGASGAPRRASYVFNPTPGNPLDDAEAFAAGFDLGYESD